MERSPLAGGTRRRARVWAAALTAVAVTVVLLGLAFSPRLARIIRADAGAYSRPITDFTSQQQPDNVTWSDPYNNDAMFIDFAGADARAIQQAGGPNLGSTFTGSITEKPLADGTALVTVHVQGTNVFTYAYAMPYSPDSLLFGHDSEEVAAGADAALGTSNFNLTFINTAPMAPLPDLAQLFVNPQPGQVPQRLSITGDATGTLRAAFGVPDGTPGEAHTAQVGLLMSPSPAIAGKGDFPSEFVHIEVAGN